MIDIGVFQLLPRGAASTDREVIEQGLWEVDFAERNGFEGIWIAEHHFSGFGLVSAPSVYAAAVAQRTRRIGIGYGVAVVPLHHPLRLAEEIAWVDHLSEGRLRVGFGPGFLPNEFEGFGVPLDERLARLKEGVATIRRAFAEETVRPHPYTRPHPPFFRASSSDGSLRPEVDGDAYFLRRICIADTDEEAIATMRAADPEVNVAAALCGTIGTVRAKIDALHRDGVRKIIGWFRFGNMPHAAVRRSMEALALSSPARASAPSPRRRDARSAAARRERV